MTIVANGKVLKIPSGGGAVQDVYSTEEVRIGTWTDGKPLYQVTVVSTTATAIERWQSVPNSPIHNVDTVVQLDALVQAANGEWLPLPYRDNGNGFLIVMVRTGLDLASYVATSDVTSRPLIVTVRYTKTTDVAGAIPPVTGGSSNSMDIYDEEERVVGTWFGKTLYRKGLIFNSITPSSSGSGTGYGPYPEIERVVRTSGYVRRSTGICAPLNCSTSWAAFDDTDKKLYLWGSSGSYNNSDWYVILEYTKVDESTASIPVSTFSYEIENDYPVIASTAAAFESDESNS